MKYPTVRLLFDRRKKASDTRCGYVEVEICFCCKRKWLSTGVQLFPRQWSPTKHVIGHPDSVLLNMRIEAVRKPVMDYISRLMIDGEEFSFDGLDAALYKNRLSGSFEEFVSERMQTRSDIQEVTRKNHRRLSNALEAFGRIKLFSDLTAQHIREFDDWLHQRGYTQTTVAAYHKFMKNYINLAMSDGLISENPYAGIRIDKGKHKLRKFLTEDELRSILSFESDDPSTRRARDLFVFQCFTGFAYADLAKFDFSTARKVDGRYVIRDVRQKSGEEFYVVLLPPALEILKRYNFNLPIISNQKYNSALKAVAAGAGLKFNLTSHMGRHTFATYCINHGIGIETIAAMLGHSNIKTTQIYAKMVNKAVVLAYDQLKSKLSDLR